MANYKWEKGKAVLIGEKTETKAPTIDEIKAVLTEKGIDFTGVTKKDDLLALMPQE